MSTKKQHILHLAKVALTSLTIMTMTMISVKSNAAINNQNKANLLEELTGKKTNQKSKIAEALKKLNTPQKLLLLARIDKKNKKYQNAIKRYNLLTTKYSQTPQGKVAYADKASMYAEMNLSDASKYNIKLYKAVSSNNKGIKK